MEISLKAYGKINLGLDVVRRREDGYHEVKMIMQTVDLWDELTFCDVTTDEIVITSDSSELPDVKDNIIYKACRMMKDIYGIDKGVHVTVDKHIPVAAGMAGGSADAAAALKAMNMLFGLNLSDEQLMEHGVKLGADVPYCIMQGTALSEGIGEILTPLPPMPDCLIVIAKPAIGVSTKWVYQNLKFSWMFAMTLILLPSLTKTQTVTSRFGSFSKEMRFPGIPPLILKGILKAEACVLSFSYTSSIVVV